MAITNYKILHTFVGPFPQGRVVTKEQLETTGADIGRLIGLKAVEPVKEEESTEPLPETIQGNDLVQKGKLDLPIGDNPPASEKKDEKKEDEQKPGEKNDKPKLEDMTTKELRDYATEIGGIDKANSMTKGELIEAIREVQNKK